jgi:hypothetical protein
MQRVPQRPQRRLLHRLTERGMCMNGAGYVFQTSPHLNRVRERRAQLGHARTDGLPADNAVVVTPGQRVYQRGAATTLAIWWRGRCSSRPNETYAFCDCSPLLECVSSYVMDSNSLLAQPGQDFPRVVMWPGYVHGFAAHAELKLGVEWTLRLNNVL